MKKYKSDSQKGKLIQIMILKWADRQYQDFEVEEYHSLFWKNIFIWASVWSRLSELKRVWIVTAEFFDNIKNWKYNWYHRAKYRLTTEAIIFYKQLYNLK